MDENYFYKFITADRLDFWQIMANDDKTSWRLITITKILVACITFTFNSDSKLVD